MKTFKNDFTIKGNNLGLFFQLNFLALIAIMSLFSGQTSAQRQQTCTPTFTVTDAPSFPGSTGAFTVASAPGQIIINANASVIGRLRKLSRVGPTTNVMTMNTLADGPVTLAPIDYGVGGVASETVTFTEIDPTQPASFKLRAESEYHAVIIDVRCPCTGNGNRNRRN